MTIEQSIQEIQTDMTDLQEAIYELVKTFEDKHGIRVDDIFLRHYDSILETVDIETNFLAVVMDLMNRLKKENQIGK